MDLARLLIDGEQGPRSPAAPGSHPLPQRPHVCAVCFRPFTSLEGLASHEPLHAAIAKNTWPLTWPCKFCSGRFGNSDLLERHERQHELQHQREALPTQLPNHDHARTCSPTSVPLRRHQQVNQVRSDEPAPTGRQDASLASRYIYSPSAPYLCHGINGSTGTQCDEAFSRLYDLTIHEEVAHNVRKRKRGRSAVRSAGGMASSFELTLSPSGHLANDWGSYRDGDVQQRDSDSFDNSSHAHPIKDVFGQGQSRPYQTLGDGGVLCDVEGCGETFEAPASLAQHRVLYHVAARGAELNNRSRTHLTWEDKRAMCQYHEDNPREKQTSIAVKFGVERR